MLVAMVALAVGPQAEVAAAVEDIQKLPAAARGTVRYASLYAVPVEERAETSAALAFALNAVSRGSLIRAPEPVPGTTLLRWDLTWYAPKANDLTEFMAAYEDLVSEDPYWHLQTLVIPAGETRPRQVTVDGGWLDLAEVARLRGLCGSSGGVLRADWLVAKLLSPPYYYEFAGVPEKEAEFYQLLGLDVKTIGKLRADEGANIFVSGVTGEVRRLVRRPGPLGGAWGSYDVAESTAERDPFRNPFAFQYDASEHIAAKGNGMHLFALYNRQGVRQDAVPDVIAKDTSDPAGKGIVLAGISCIRCHVEDGLRPFSNDQRKLFEAGVVAFTEKQADAERLEQFYASTKEATHLQRDREDYAAAVKRATGLSVPAAARAVARTYRRVVDDVVTSEVAVRELGVRDLRQLARSTDPVLLALSAGISVQRAQWESSWQEAMLLVAGGE